MLSAFFSRECLLVPTTLRNQDPVNWNGYPYNIVDSSSPRFLRHSSSTCFIASTESIMAGKKRSHTNGDGGDDPYHTPPHASSSRGYSSQALSQPRPPKSGRTSYTQTGRTPSGSSQYDPVVIDDDDDEDDYDASQEVQDSSQSFGEADMSYVSYGVWDTKIVGVRYYNGHATIGEIAIPRREPNNAYDRECFASNAAT